MSGDRIAESELVLPSLYLMTQNNGFIRTSVLISQLEDILKPQGVDAQILPNRKDTYFSQKVRNLKSHDTLERGVCNIFRWPVSDYHKRSIIC